MTDPSILDEILKELRRAKKKHPRWPVHLTAQAGIVVEEAGELMRACLNKKYEGKASGRTREEMLADIRIEAVHTAASCIRFMEQLIINQNTEHVKHERKSKHQHQESEAGQGGQEAEPGL